MRLFSNQSTYLAIALAAAVSASSCTREDSDSAMQEEVAGLRTELEQLANAVGRLEFRIYELENQQESRGDEAVDANTDIAPQTGTDGDTIDLTPIN